MKISVSKIRIFLCTGLLLILWSAAQSQVYQNPFQEIIDLGRDEANFTLMQNNAQSYFFMPGTGSPLDALNPVIFETDQDYQPLWAGLLSISSFNSARMKTMVTRDLIKGQDSAIYACGYIEFDTVLNPRIGFICRLDFNGGSSWLHVYPPVMEYTSIIAVNSYRLSACGYIATTVEPVHKACVTGIFSDGSHAWTRRYPATDTSLNSEMNQLIMRGDTIAAVGNMNRTATDDHSDILLAELNIYGYPYNQVSYNRCFDSSFQRPFESGMSIKFTGTHYYITGDYIHEQPTDRDVYLMQINQFNLYPDWVKHYPVQNNSSYNEEYTQRFISGQDTGISICGYVEHEMNGQPNKTAFLLTTDLNGDYPLERYYGDQGEDRFYKGMFNSSGVMVMAGYSNSFGSDEDIYIVEHYFTEAEQCHDSVYWLLADTLCMFKSTIEWDSVKVTPHKIKYNINEMMIRNQIICEKTILWPRPSGSTLESTPRLRVKPLEPGLYVFSEQISSCKVYSMDGSLVYSYAGNTMNLDLRTVKPGVYVLEALTSNNQVCRFKIMKL